MKSLQSLSYKTLFTILFFSLAGIIFFLRIGKPTNKVSAAWWDEMWHYRKAISITNSSGSNQINVQVKILENYDLSSLVNEGKIQSDLDDIRFTDINGNLIDYWIEDSTNTSVDIWGLISLVPSSNTDIYMYYGNNFSNSMSNNTWMIDIGGTISYLNGYRIHAFKDSGTYYKYHDRSVEVLVIAGGGGGGYRHGAGGGAGGLIYQQSINITENTTVTVGSGGSGSTSSTPNQQDGGNSTFLSLTAIGGGRGGQWDGLRTGSSGGSGGGSCSVTNVAGTFGQGNSGGNGYNGTSPYNWGGGGGAGQIGGNGTSTAHGNGGDGIYYGDKFGDIYGEIGWFAGGGGGGGHDPTATQGYGGNGGGGDGGIPSVNSPGQDGIVNTGGGGGGASTSSGGNSRGGNGGSGIVLIRYPTTVITSSDVISDTPANEETGGGPIANWKLNGNIIDSINNLNTTFGNSQPELISAKNNLGYNFTDIDDQYIYAQPNSIFDSSSSGFTVSFWLKVNGASSTTYQGVIGKGLDNDWGCFLNQAGTTLYFRISSTTINASIPSVDTWYYWTLWWNGSEMKIFRDTTEMATTSKTSINNLDLGIGIGKVTDRGITGGTIYNLNGVIDEVTIYNYARSNNQITSEYNFYNSISGSSVNLGIQSNTAPSLKSKLVAYWKFNENVGTTTYDSSGYNNTGILYGATWEPVKNGIGLSLGGYGSNNYIGIVQTALDNDTSWSVSTKIKYFNLSKTHEFFLGKTDSTTGKILLRHNGYISFRATNGTYYDFSTTSAEIHNTDNTLAFISDGTTIKLYINGIYKSSVTPASTSFSVNTIGNAWTDTVWTSAFLIDELKIYDSAITDEEVKQDYNAGSVVQFGSTSQSIGGTTTSLEYCIPGDTTYCAPPVAEWKMDEGVGTSIVDTSGNNNTGVFGTGNSAPTWSQGKIGKSLSYDGSGKYAYIDSFNGINNLSSFTICSWVYLNTLGNTNNIDDSGIFSQNSDTGALFWYNVDNNHSYTFNYGSVNTSSNRINGTANAAIANRWQFICGLMNGSTRQLFIDGRLNNSKTGSAQTTATLNGSGVRIGGWSSSNNFNIDGKIDNIRIYDYARTPAQIAYDYNKGAPVGWWKMDECEGSTAYDWSGNQNHGTINIGSGGSQNSLGTCAVGTSAAWTNGANGKINSSLNFDGVDDYINFGNSQNFEDKDFSVSFWVKANTSGNKGIICKSNGGAPTVNYGFLINNPSSNVIGFASASATGSWGIDGTYSAKFSVSNLSTQFNHIVIIGDRDKTDIDAYVNGQKQTLLAYVGGLGKFNLLGNITNSLNFVIGAESNDLFFDGQIDDVRIYNYALTAEQVKQVYNDGAVNFR